MKTERSNALKAHTRARIKLRLARRKKTARKRKRVAGEFWRDVAGYKKLLGGTHKDAVAAVKWSVKWVEKRQARMSKKRREKSVKQIIIEREMRKHKVTDMMQAKDWFEKADY